MFSLIITVISIALVAALALATIYYGGSAFNKGSDGAKAAQLINEGQQINAAVAMHNAENTAAGGAGATDIAGLVTANYLAQVPQSFLSTTALSGGKVTATTTAKVCGEVQKRAVGVDTVIAAEGNQLFGCVTTGGASEFFYKF